MFLAISSCEKEKIQRDKEVQTASNAPIKLIHEGLSADFPLLIEKKSMGDSLNGETRDYILSHYGYNIETESYRSLSFGVTNSPREGFMENIVFSRHKGRGTRVFLIEYDLTETEKELIGKGEYVSLAGKLVGMAELIPQDPQGGYEYESMILDIPCEISYETIEYCTGSQNHPNGREADGSECPAHESRTVVVLIPCDGGAYGDGFWPSDSDPLNNPLYGEPPYDIPGGSTINPDPNKGEVATTPAVQIASPAECNKINELLSNNPEFKDKIKDLASQANLNLNYEQSASLFDGSSNIEEEQGLPNVPGIILDYDTSKNFIAFFHNHADTGSSALSIFTLDDLVAIARWIRLGHINTDKFVAFLATEKGTYYALTIDDPQKLLDLLYKRTFLPNELGGSNIDLMRYQTSSKVFYPYFKEYFKPDNPNRLINENDTDNENVLKQFLKFIKRADAGVSLFETDENFENFEQLSRNFWGKTKRLPCGGGE